MTVINYFKLRDQAGEQIALDILQNSPLLNFIPRKASEDGLTVKWYRQAATMSVGMRNTNAQFTSQDVIPAIPVVKELLKAGQTLPFDVTQSNANGGEGVIGDTIRECLRLVMVEINDKIINGDWLGSGNQEFDGAAVLSAANSMTTNYDTPVTTQATALAASNIFNTAMNQVASSGGVYVTNVDGLNILNLIRGYGGMTFNPVVTEIPAEVGRIGTRPVILGGNKVDGTDVVSNITVNAHTHVPFYYINTDPVTGLALSIEREILTRNTDRSIEYVTINVPAMLCDLSKRCCYRASIRLS